jgi:hypothetical protein
MERQPWLGEALTLRRWDEEAKQPGRVVPALASYRELLESCFGRQAWETAAVGGHDLAASL